MQVFDPGGELLGEIAVPGAVNFAFGGAGRNVLLITADTAMWAATTPDRARRPDRMPLVRTRRIIDTAGADAVIAAAEAAPPRTARRVVHRRRRPVRRARRDAPHRTARRSASARVAVDKARTAAIFVRPSREMEEQVTGGRLGALALHGASCLTGGIPLKVGDEVVGAIGTSGETPDEDEAISIAGAAATFSTPRSRP